MLLPRPTCNDPAILITWDSEGGVCAASVCQGRDFGVIPRLCGGLVCGDVNPDVGAGSCSAQQRNGLSRVQRVRADEPAETHGQTHTQTDRQADTQTGARGGGATACSGSLDPLRIEPSPLLFGLTTPLPFVLDGGKAEHGGAAPGCFSRCLYG